MQRLYMDKHGRVTIPSRIRRQLGMGDETPLFAEMGPHGLVLRPLLQTPSLQKPSLHEEDTPLVDEEEASECVLGGETLKPAERRRILSRLAG